MAVARAPVVELDEAFWRRVIDTKLLCSCYADWSKIRKGTNCNIVMVSSNAGEIEHSNFAAYVVANIEFRNFTGNLSIERSLHNISVDTVGPSLINPSG